MSQIKVCLAAVIGYKDFAVLERAHGAGIDIDIRIEFLRRDFETASFEQTSERRGCDTFTNPGNDTAGYENIFRHLNPLSVFFTTISF